MMNLMSKSNIHGQLHRKAKCIQRPTRSSRCRIMQYTQRQGSTNWSRYTIRTGTLQRRNRYRTLSKWKDIDWSSLRISSFRIRRREVHTIDLEPAGTAEQKLEGRKHGRSSLQDILLALSATTGHLRTILSGEMQRGRTGSSITIAARKLLESLQTMSNHHMDLDCICRTAISSC